MSFESARADHLAGWHEGASASFAGVCRDCDPAPKADEGREAPQIRFWSSRRHKSMSVADILRDNNLPFNHRSR